MTRLSSLSPSDVIQLDSLLNDEARETLNSLRIGLFSHRALVNRVVVHVAEDFETSVSVRVKYCGDADCGCSSSPPILFSGPGSADVTLELA